MATWQMTNVQTGGIEGPKFNAFGMTAEMWTVALPTSLALGDVILGPTLPANCYFNALAVDCGQLDTGNTVAFEVGYTGLPAAIIAAGNTAGQAGAVVNENVPGCIAFSSTTNLQVIMTITRAASVPVAGKVTMSLEYTASP